MGQSISRAKLKNFQARKATSRLEETLAKLAKGQDNFSMTQDDLTMTQAELESSMVGIEKSQDCLARFHAQNEISPPPQGKMQSLEEVMTKWAKSRAKFMENTRANLQFQPTPLKNWEEATTPKATSHTQLVTEIEQPLK